MELSAAVEAKKSRRVVKKRRPAQLENLRPEAQRLFSRWKFASDHNWTSECAAPFIRMGWRAKSKYIIFKTFVALGRRLTLLVENRRYVAPMPHANLGVSLKRTQFFARIAIHEKSLDQKEPALEHLDERRQCGIRSSTQPCDR
jgi:hypothetical protein